MKKLFFVSLILGIWFMTGVSVLPEASAALLPQASNGINGEFFGDLAWENIGRQLIEVNAVWVDNQNPRIILTGTNRGVFKTGDSGITWQAVLFGANKGVNFLYVDQENKDLIYACCTDGLFFSHNQGKDWQRIYQGDSEQAANCLSLIKLENKELYLCTEAGLVRSQDNTWTWRRFPGRLGTLPIRAIAADQINELIYLATPEGVYRVEPQAGAKRIFVFRETDLEETLEEEEAEEEPEQQINYICIDPNKPQNIYLATTKGIFKSEDSGLTWERFPDFGLLSKGARFITILPDSLILVATKSGVFTYSRLHLSCYEENLQSKKGQNEGRWRELSLKLAMQDIRFLTVDHYGNIYAAGNKGLFRSTSYRVAIHKGKGYPSVGIEQEPSIQQVQQAAIKYAQVIDPQWIAAHRRLSRLKAILPDFSLNYDKTIYGSATTKVNGTYGNVITGPRDWGISLKWSLGDLIWSEQQRLIDSQVRLMVKLRQDILDEVTRLYFERRRMQLELVSSRETELVSREDKELKIQELTALLDGLTGGYVSKKLGGKI